MELFQNLYKKKYCMVNIIMGNFDLTCQPYHTAVIMTNHTSWHGGQVTTKISRLFEKRVNFIWGTYQFFSNTQQTRAIDTSVRLTMMICCVLPMPQFFLFFIWDVIQQCYIAMIISYEHRWTYKLMIFRRKHKPNLPKR